jgi:ABC-type glycerol-3-phosphate transport system substrate-binding protein
VLLTGADAKLPKAEASGIEKIGHETGAFFYSFFEDYNSIGSTTEGGKRATVWIGSGRDQAQVIKQMIDDSFTPQTGIEIDLKLVNMGVLLPATLAGQGPDVAMNVGAETPVNFAMRGAAQDLTVFPDYEETIKRFYDSALVPFSYRNKLYALPETQTFAMLFYRKDILAEMGLGVPQSWDDLFSLIPELQKNNMQFAFPLEQDFTRLPSMPPNSTFMSMLLQAGGRLYADDGKRVELDSEAAMQSFKQWVELYTSYKLPLIFDFPNRFRTGEMPIGIADYSLYNHLSVSAPELRGLWGFAPIPGTKAEDGAIHRDEPGTGSSVLMLQTAENKDNGWEFMKWWTDKETQVRFGREMEGLMGAAARYPTANVEALAELPWPVKDLRSLQEQWQWVHGVPEVPGSYFTGRHLDNAFRKSVAENTNARETLYDYMQFINDEIATKRREFKLPE